LDLEATPHEYTSLSTEQTIIIVGAIVLTIWHLTRTRDDVLPIKHPSDTNSLSGDEGLSEDEYIAMSTAESEYIEIAKCYYAYDPCDQEGRLQQQHTFLRLEAEADALAAPIHRPRHPTAHSTNPTSRDPVTGYRHNAPQLNEMNAHTAPSGIQKRSPCRSNTPKKQQGDNPHLEKS
jgi:hypothetical protein